MRDIPVNGLLRFGILAICANVDENSTNGDPLAAMVMDLMAPMVHPITIEAI